MLDASVSDTQITLRPLPHVKVADAAEIQQKFYTFGQQLGRGSFGTVLLATELKTGTKWAVKIINKAQSGTSRLKLLEREISILRAVHHPHIIYLERVFESPSMLFLVFELCLCELRELFTKKKIFTEEETRLVIKSLASAVSYLHRNDIVHRDLKLENILVAVNPNDESDNLYIKVTDFGLSVVRGGVGHESMLQEMVGTPVYMSPELFGARMYSQQCDVWAMGVIMYLLLTGNYPFEPSKDQTLASVVTSEPANFDVPAFQGEEHKPLRMLLQKMLEKNPAYRATAREVEGDPWTRGSSEESAATNAMELMRLWRTDMRQPSVSVEGPAERAVRSGREQRLSIMAEMMAGGLVQRGARASAVDARLTPPMRATLIADERQRNAVLRKTFGSFTPAESVMVMPQRAVRRYSVDPAAATAAAQAAVAAQTTPQTTPQTTQWPHTAQAGAGWPRAEVPGSTRRRRSITGRSPRLSLVEAHAGGFATPPAAARAQRSTHPVVFVTEPDKEETETPRPRTTGKSEYGVVGRQRDDAAAIDVRSVANLLPADRAPPIVYYESDRRRKLTEAAPRRSPRPRARTPQPSTRPAGKQRPRESPTATTLQRPQNKREQRFSPRRSPLPPKLNARLGRSF